MSTRSQILFINGEAKVLTYRHSDGYLSGVIPDLIDFLKWNSSRNSDFEYTLANYFYWNKRHIEKSDFEYKEVKGKIVGMKKKKGSPIDKVRADPNDYVLLGHGLCADNRIHSDIEFFYKVHFIEHETDKNGFFPRMSYKIEAYKIDNAYQYAQAHEIPEDLKIWELSLEHSDLKTNFKIGKELLEPKEETYVKEDYTMYASHYNYLCGRGFICTRVAIWKLRRPRASETIAYAVMNAKDFRELVEKEKWTLEREEEEITA